MSRNKGKESDTGWLIMRSNTLCVLPAYLFYFLWSDHHRQCIERLGNGEIDQEKHINEYI